MNSRGRYLAIMASIIPAAILAQAKNNYANVRIPKGVKVPYKPTGWEARAQQSKYMPHDGARKAERERRNWKWESSNDRRARALASMNSKGLPYHWEFEHLPNGFVKRHLLAHGQTLKDRQQQKSLKLSERMVEIPLVNKALEAFRKI